MTYTIMMKINNKNINVVPLFKTYKMMITLEECHLLGCDIIRLLLELTFRRNVSPP
jgi:hypothetical protein